MTTLVTGATGFIGSHVTRVLAERAGNVRILVRPQSQSKIIENLSVERISGDLRDISSLRRALEGVDQVFHVAADYRLWARQSDEIYENNVIGTRNLIQASREAGVQRFVYTSSVATLAARLPGDLINEDTQTSIDDMIGHYKSSKFLAEQEVKNAVAAGFPAVIVNPTMPVGPGDWKPTPTGRIIVDFLNGRMPAYVDTGFNVVAVEDVAEGHWLAAKHGRIGERYILGGSNMTLKRLLDVLSAATGLPSPRIRLPQALALTAGYIENAFCTLTGREPRIPLDGVRMAKHKIYADCARATRELGLRTGNVDAALVRAAQWYLNNGYVPYERHKIVRLA